MMTKIAILGANSLLGQHLLRALSSTADLGQRCLYNRLVVNVWNAYKRFDYRLGDNSLDLLVVKEFIGLDQLQLTVWDCDVVFNLHELQDFSLVPNKKLMHIHNVEYVRALIDFCATPRADDRPSTVLVHLSSFYLQSSSRWPNVYGREAEDYEKFRAEVPFQPYCDTKNEAEQAIRQSEKLQSVLARVGPLYGEGDVCSLVCDTILISRHLPQIPRVGDQNGVTQFTYAGNAAHALLKTAEKLLEDPGIHSEVVLISDATPVRSLYDLMLEPLFEDEHAATESAFIRKISNRRVSFYLVYPLYMMLAQAGHLLDFCMGAKNPLAELPHPDYVYIALHHWTFFSDFKLRIFFGHTSRFDYKTSLERSLDYYRRLKPEQISKFSWLP